jgi:spore germination cell wall hydrolase CwlJ-like protein
MWVTTKRGSFVFFLLLLIPIFYAIGYNWQQSSVQTPTALDGSQEKNVSAKQYKPVNVEYIKCMAENIYWEASGEPFMGQVAVARVVMNRVKHGFASNPCRVIYQSKYIPLDDETDRKVRLCQFSWVCADKPTPNRNRRYIQAEEIATKVLLHDQWSDVIPSNILFFHNTSVNPGWSYRRVMEIGNHIFYSKK